MKNLACTLLFSATLIRLSAAAELPLATADAPAEPVAAQQNALEVKNKSTFVMEESGRNPFWPIGWKPTVKQSSNTMEQAGPQLLPSSFLVSSITVDQGGSFAIINGKVMNEGQVFGLQLGNQTYQITVKAIQDGQVILLRRDQEIAVPLRRR